MTLVLLSICGNNGHCNDNSLTMVKVRLIVVYKEMYKTKRNSSHSERHLRLFKLLSSADILMYVLAMEKMVQCWSIVLSPSTNT